MVDESSQSDNLVLRVDSQVMGGLVLDSQYKHKAAGGLWKIFQAVRKLDDDEEIDQSVITQTRLRIKLLVPPDKEQSALLPILYEALLLHQFAYHSSYADVGCSTRKREL